MQLVSPPQLEQDDDVVAIMPLPLDVTKCPPLPAPNLRINNATVDNIYLAAVLLIAPDPDLASTTDATVENTVNGADIMLDVREAPMFASAKEAI